MKWVKYYFSRVSQWCNARMPSCKTFTPIEGLLPWKSGHMSQALRPPCAMNWGAPTLEKWAYESGIDAALRHELRGSYLGKVGIWARHWCRSVPWTDVLLPWKSGHMSQALMPPCAMYWGAPTLEKWAYEPGIDAALRHELRGSYLGKVGIWARHWCRPVSWTIVLLPWKSWHMSQALMPPCAMNWGAPTLEKWAYQPGIDAALCHELRYCYLGKVGIWVRHWCRPAPWTEGLLPWKSGHMSQALMPPCTMNWGAPTLEKWAYESGIDATLCHELRGSYLGKVGIWARHWCRPAPWTEGLLPWKSGHMSQALTPPCAMNWGAPTLEKWTYEPGIDAALCHELRGSYLGKVGIWARHWCRPAPWTEGLLPWKSGHMSQALMPPCTMNWGAPTLEKWTYEPGIDAALHHELRGSYLGKVGIWARHWCRPAPWTEGLLPWKSGHMSQALMPPCTMNWGAPTLEKWTYEPGIDAALHHELRGSYLGKVNIWARHWCRPAPWTEGLLPWKSGHMSQALMPPCTMNWGAPTLEKWAYEPGIDAALHHELRGSYLGKVNIWARHWCRPAPWTEGLLPWKSWHMSQALMPPCTMNWGAPTLEKWTYEPGIDAALRHELRGSYLGKVNIWARHWCRPAPWTEGLLPWKSEHMSQALMPPCTMNWGAPTLEKWTYEPGIDAALRHELAERGLEEEDGDADEEDAREVRDQEGACNA